MNFLNFYSPYMPYSVSPFSIWHDSYKIDSHHIRIDFIFVDIHKCGSFERSSFHNPKCIKRMSMVLVLSITDFYKYKKITIWSNDINFSSLNLVISFEYFPSFSLEILYCDFLSLVSYASSWWRHGVGNY